MDFLGYSTTLLAIRKRFVKWKADLIVNCPRSPVFGGLALGPKSVGHVARFVLDHAPCPVLLIRLPVDEKA